MFKRWKEGIRAEQEFWLVSEQVRFESEEVERKYRSLTHRVGRSMGITAHWKILDLGCGPAPVSRLFKSATRVALDPLIDTYKRANILTGMGFHWVQGRAEELPIKGKVFDLIVCRNVLDHVENPVAAMEEMARVLRNRGIVFVAVRCYTDFLANFKRKVEKSPLAFAKEIYHPHYLTISDLRRLCNAHFVTISEVIVHEGKNCLDLGKVAQNPGTSRVSFSTRLLSFVGSLFGLLYKREFEKLRGTVFIAFWYLVGFLNKLVYQWYAREYLIIAELAG